MPRAAGFVSIWLRCRTTDRTTTHPAVFSRWSIAADLLSPPTVPAVMGTHIRKRSPVSWPTILTATRRSISTTKALTPKSGKILCWRPNGITKSSFLLSVRKGLCQSTFEGHGHDLSVPGKFGVFGLRTRCAHGSEPAAAVDRRAASETARRF